MSHWLDRTALLLGKENISKLNQSHILIVGLGGVGAYAAEQLVRSGIGNLTMVDGDTIHITNINRQLPATQENIGKSKLDILKQRFLEINPNLNINSINRYIEDTEMEDLVLSYKFDYVIDAIDTLSPKIHLIKGCIENKIPLVSSMGAGAKIDPSKIMITDISKSYNDRLAFLVRKNLRKHKIYKGFKVVFSSELAKKEAIISVDNEKNKRSTVGTISYLPASFGIFCASHVIRCLTEEVGS